MSPRVALTFTAAALLSGCAATRPPPMTLTAESAADDLASRSLHSETLRRFLAEEAGRPPPEQAWDFETLSWVAFHYHPALAVARAQWATARAAQATAALRPNPTLTVTPGYNFTREPGVSPWLPGVNLDFLLPTTQKRSRQQEIARAEAEAARLAVLTTVWQVRHELRGALADVAMAEKRAAMLATQTKAQQALVALLDQRQAAGGATAGEVANARVALLRLEATAAETQSQVATARVRVAAALGLPATALEGIALAAPTAAPALSSDGLATARREALRSRADVLAALAKFHAANAAVELEVARQMPDFHLGPGYQWDQGGNKWSLALTLELPVFHRNEAAIAEAVARRAEAAAQFGAVQAQALSAIEAAIAAQQAAAAQQERANRIRTEIGEQTGRVQQRVTLGAADQLELQLARVEAAAADSLLVEADIAGAVAAGQLEDALQIPFPRLQALADPARVQLSASP